MKSRADEMPARDVAVYCASCIMSMTVGEDTLMPDADIERWNRKILSIRK